MTGTKELHATRLRDLTGGEVLTSSDDGYDSARTVWNAMVDHRPEVVIRCRSRDDVAAAVRYAREHGLEIGVRCGGHSVIGHAVPDGGLMVDLTPLGRVRVDPAQRRAHVQGGALLGALDRATLPHGLATTAGNVSHTGVGGLVLGGGMGWLARQHGLSCDNVLSYEVVTATGEVVRASATEHADLFWGLRGGGGNFGVVTDFELALHPIEDRTLVADLQFPVEQGPDVLRGWRELLADAPREATLTASAGQDGPEPYVTVGFVWVGAPHGADRLLDRLRALGRAAGERLTELSYLALQQVEDTPQGHAYRRYWKGHYFDALPDEALAAFALRGTADGRGDLLPNASLQAYGGAIAEVPDDATAFSHRGALVEFVAAARWEDAAEDEARMAAARRYAATLAPYASGAYVNALGDEGDAGVRRAYPPHKLARLRALKQVWDPDNVFHRNHNIAP
jgi:FAD/FMN-containing dehydrogenase